jgi:hypothetical protein
LDSRSDQTKQAVDQVVASLKRYSNNQEFVAAVMGQVVRKIAKQHKPAATQSFEYDVNNERGLL